LNTKEDIERASEQIMKGTGVSKLAALDMLFDKYQSQRHFEEAVQVRTVINREQDKVEYYGHGFQQDM
jgi:hypothetical protein